MGLNIQKGPAASPTARCTGIPTFDEALGGGFRGIVLVQGGPLDGKTTLCLHAVREAQKGGSLVGWIELENRLDGRWAKEIGVRTEDLLVAYPRYKTVTEVFAQYVPNLIEAGAKLIVVDSLGGLRPFCVTAEDAREHAVERELDGALPELSDRVAQADVVVVLISQIRERYGITFGADWRGMGGHAARHWVHQTVNIKQKSRSDDGIQQHTVVVTKNTWGPRGKAMLEIQTV